MIGLNSDLSPVPLWTDVNQFGTNVVSVVLRIEIAPFCTRREQVKFEWIPYTRQHDFRILNRVFSPFWRFLFGPKPDLLIVDSTITSRLVKGGSSLSPWLFDGTELSQK
jgi:hypothetical protein